MAQTIKLKRGTTTPTTSDIVSGEVAVDTSAQKLYINDNGTVKEIGGGGGIDNVVEDTTPQLGGDLASNGNDILFADNDKAIFGAGNDLQIYHDGTDTQIREVGAGNLKIITDGAAVQIQSTLENMIVAQPNDAVTLYYDNSQKLETTSTGIDVTGGIAATSDSTFSATSGNIYVTTSTTAGAGRSGFRVDETSTNGFEMVHDNTDNAFFISRRSGNATVVDTLKIDRSTGDFSLFEDTGTTAKLTWDASAESLGIGTTSPQSPVHIEQDQQTVSTTTLDNGTAVGLQVTHPSGPGAVANQGVAIALGSRNRARSYITSTYSGTSKDACELSFYNETGGVIYERMRIKTSGRVGIGTSSPSSLLDVAGDVTVGGDINLGDNDKVIFGAGSDLQIFHDGSNSYITDVGTGSIWLKTNGPNISFLDSSNNYMIRANTSGTVDLYNNGSRKLQTTSTGIDVTGDIRANDTYPTIYVNHSGTLLGGIRADASTKLELKTLTTAPLSFQVNSSEKMRIDSSGNVGIGTSSPANLLHIRGGAATLEIDSSTNTANLDFDNSTQTARIQLANNDLATLVGGTERMRIDSSGNVGIGTTSPAGLLEISADSDDGTAAPSFLITNASTTLDDGAVVGTIEFRNSDTSGTGPHVAKIQGIANESDERTTELVFSTGSVATTTEAMRIDSSGNVGIGTSSPACPLHVKTTDDGTTFRLESTEDGAAGAPDFLMYRNSATPADNDVLGVIFWNGNDDGGSNSQYAYQRLVATDVTAGSENARMDFNIVTDGSVDRALEIDGTGIDVTGTVTADGLTVNGDANFGDNDKLVLGDSTDLQIYHSGSESIIHDNGPGPLKVRTTGFQVRNAGDTADLIKATVNGSAFLYHDGSEKLKTESAGINVTGTVTADGLTVSSITYPTTDGTNGQVLTTDGSGNLSFADAEGGSGVSQAKATAISLVFG